MGTLYSGSPGNGRGIWASNSDILVEGSIFDACQVGVYAFRSSTTVQAENEFLDCSFGIFVADPVDKTVLIKDNVSVDVERSIFVWGLGPAKSISISDNEIAAKPLPTSTGITGIHISGYPTFMTAIDGITIETNIVKLL
ncbi:right-handed parallel beta-helix repeat-containing protein, partial [Arthrospira platensis SPKY1]|nr:right-handed parallel beta-helix repeat-containing protein [Arthrospira platensis SPKY1]